ncbi:hypothetical protein NC653_017906 [Populus alba x Populus x berolinensis]|uniref:Uncharacterized protein n=1 Tax=Populus alba x Populus x berolinensis TaxID=444605 RepID=A0AAD6W1S7_9ROSI|nr:hypothetical protein NC653_017906 [Populus alba x Populus x berolinensis]
MRRPRGWPRGFSICVKQESWPRSCGSQCLLRLALRPEVHRFSFEIISALIMQFNHELPETSWFCKSRLLHESVKKHRY